MTRQENSNPSPTPDAQDGDQVSRAAATAAALIELAIHESLAPVNGLGRALARLSAMLPQASAEMRAELDTCIETLQFHDRMVQQLSQVRDLLAGANAARSAAADPPGWPALRERLRAHFTSESHRMLFNLLLPGESEAAPIHLHADEGSVELF